MKSQYEALLFSSGKAMDEEQLASLIGTDKAAVRKSLKELQKDYAERDTALKLFNEGSLWKLLVKDEHIHLVRRIVADTELSKATLETLAVVAFNHPKILQSRVVDQRGGNAYEHIKELLDLGFITRQKEGRSFAIRLTEKFFEYFDVEGEGSIKSVFKDVKEPAERQRQLGGLQVVDELPETEHEKKERENKALLGDLEVVDEPEKEFADAPAKLEESEEEKQEHESFLNNIEGRIDELSSRNDNREDDEDFKPAETAEEELYDDAPAGDATEEAEKAVAEAEKAVEEAEAKEEPEETADAEEPADESAEETQPEEADVQSEELPEIDETNPKKE